MAILSRNEIYSNDSSYNGTVQYVNSSGTEIGKFCKAYVSFNYYVTGPLLGGPGMYSSFNVSSVTYNGGNYYTINFSYSAPTAYFSSFSHCSTDGEYGSSYNCVMGYYSATTSSLTIIARGSDPYGGRSVFRDAIFAGAFW